MSKKHIRYIINSICLFLAVVIWGNVVKVSAEEEILTGNVLIINSYGVGHLWETNVLEGFFGTGRGLKETDFNVKVEYLDFKNRSDEIYIDKFIEYLEIKYPKGTVDIIYSIDDESYGVMSKVVMNKESEFYQVPLVFSGVDNAPSLSDEEKECITGYYQNDGMKQSIALMMRLHSNTDRIIVVAEESGFGDMLVQRTKEIIVESGLLGVDVQVVQSNFLEDIEEGLSQLPKGFNELIMIGGEFSYKDKLQTIEPKTVIETIKGYGKRPIYTYDQSYLDTGIVGGYMDIGQEQGRAIYYLICKILQGTKVEDLQVIVGPSQKYVLDYKSIYEYDISVAHIPANSMILNKKFYNLLWSPSAKRILVIGLLCGLAAIVIDVVLMVQYHNKKRKQNEIMRRQKEREQLKTDFMVNMSHELRTPINIIINASNLVKLDISQLEQGSMLTGKLDQINLNAYRLLKLANNFIDITKLEEGVFKVKKGDVNIVTLVEEAFMGTIDIANRKQIEVVFDPQEEEVIIGVDEDIIQRVILNLLSNSFKFTPVGGKVYGGLWCKGNEVVIEVRDTGVGIAADEINHIFDRFYQVDNSLSRTSEGSGVGLCIVKELIELHEGRIEVESQLGKGTTFRIYLPNKQVDKQANKCCISSLDTAVNIELSDVVK